MPRIERPSRIADLVAVVRAGGADEHARATAERFQIDLPLVILVATALTRGSAPLGGHDPGAVEAYTGAALRWRTDAFRIHGGRLVIRGELQPLAAELAATLDAEREARQRLSAVLARQRTLAQRLLARGDDPGLLALAVRLARRAGHDDALGVYSRVNEALSRFAAQAVSVGATATEARRLAVGRLTAVVEQHGSAS